jgi:prophage antirepressor-like protein
MEIQIFKNDRFGEVRTMVINDEPWFVGKDVASVLGYLNPQKAIRDHVDDEDRLGERIVLSGQNRMTILINESGLYALILSSKLPQAKEFKRWVTSEVLPSIRRNGAYLTDDALARFAEDPDYGIKLLNTLKRERTERLALMKENVTLSLENNRMKPMADYCARILACTDTVTVTQIAQDYGMTAQDFNEMLADMKIQYRCGRQWILYSGYKQQGFVQSATTTYTRYDGTKGVRVSSRWTQLGRIFLYERLKGEGVMPIG